MNRTIISLAIGVSVALLAAQVVHARGFGGYHGGSYSGGGYHESGNHEGGGYHQGGYHEGGGGYHEGGGYHQGGNQEGGYHEGGYSGGQPRGGYSGSEPRGGYPSGGKGYSGAEGAAAGSAAEKRNAPQYSGAEGAAAGAAAEKRNSPQYSGAQGAAAGYAAGKRNTPSAGTAQVALPTDAGYGMPAAGAAAYAGNHQTEALGGSVYAARGAAVRSSYSGAGMYGQGWYGAHPGTWAPAGWTAGQAWNAASWPAVGVSLGWSGSVQPVVYDYGNNVTYQGDQVCYGGQPVATADQYYQQASSLAQSAPPPDLNAGEWLPLGVFALVHKDQSDPQLILQLAVNKSGTLAGNYSDLMSGTTVPIHGAVDKKTQRVAWTVGDNKQTVGETGLYNLTQDESPALIHVGKDKTQQWTLVRLKQPDQNGGEK
jgi:hypothetical protein